MPGGLQPSARSTRTKVGPRPASRREGLSHVGTAGPESPPWTTNDGYKNLFLTLFGEESRCQPNPPGRDGSEMQQPILGLYTAPPRLELVVWACLGPPWPSLPAEPCDPPSVGHFSLASKGTERGPHRPACGMRETKRYSTTAQPKLDQVDS